MRKRLTVSFLALIICAQVSAQNLTSGLLDRDQIDEKYKWDFSDIYESDEDWEKDLGWIRQNISRVEEFEGTLGGSSSALLACLEFNDEMDRKLNWVRLYADMHRDVDMNSEKYQEMWSRFSSLESEVNTATSFINPEIISIPESTIHGFISENEGLKVYQHFLEELLLKQEHTLPAAQEEILARFSRLLDSPYSVFGKFVYAELPFPTIRDDKGEEIILNRSTSWRARSSPDRGYRKKGYEGYYGSLADFKGTLAQNLANHIDGKMIDAGIRDYDSALAAAFARYNLPVEIYDTLIETARDNIEPFHRWMRIKKDILGYDTLYVYDTKMSIFSETEREFSWEEARDLMFESLAPMGDDYVDDLREAYDKRWVDAYPHKGKETGGYSSGPNGPHPYVKMNWGGKVMDYTTLVHEFGHYVHAYKTMRTQPYIYHDYPSFLAEIASTTAECVSWAHLIDGAETPSEKLYQIEQFIEITCMYFYTAALNAEFELLMYREIEEGGSLTAESMSEIYADLSKVYYGDAVTLTEYDSYVWAEWPHFYLDFYIYSYATSFAASLQLAESIRGEGKPAVERFTSLLEAGNSDYPVEILKRAGVDLTSREPIEALTKRLNELMDEVEKMTGND